MKRYFLGCIGIFLSLLSFSQADTSLAGRLQVFLQANDSLDFDRILDFTYPKIFELSSREDMQELMQNAFENEDLSIDMDSLTVLTIHPAFAFKTGRYALVDYTMLMTMKFKSDDPVDSNGVAEQRQVIISSLSEQYGKENVSYNTSTSTIRIFITSSLAAVKDQLSKQWCFLNFKKDDSLMEQLLPPEVIDRLSNPAK